MKSQPASPWVRDATAAIGALVHSGVPVRDAVASVVRESLERHVRREPAREQPELREVV